MSTSRWNIIVFLLIICYGKIPLQSNAHAATGQPGQTTAKATAVTATATSTTAFSRRALDRYTFSELHMGGRTTLTIYAPSEAIARSACRLAFARVSQLEDIMSDYRIASEINRLAATSGPQSLPVKISSDLFFVLAYAQEISRLSDGAFDVTIAPLVQLWRRARKSGVLPAKGEIEAAKQLVNWRFLKLDRKNQTAQLLKPGVKLDLGGIAKGYAGDCALDVLRRQGITSAMFESGGDIVMGEAPPGKNGWQIGFESPSSGAPKIFSLSNCAISTSGDTNQFVVIGGKHYSHVVNPKTGLGLTSRVACTVIAARGITTDVLSTTFSIADKKAGRRLLRAFPQTKAFIRAVR